MTEELFLYIMVLIAVFIGSVISLSIFMSFYRKSKRRGLVILAIFIAFVVNFQFNIFEISNVLGTLTLIIITGLLIASFITLSKKPIASVE
ncbi:hypothetical protein [Alkalibacillus haloalkaliphilus]|uniref:Uncharacterized protein n=1 Tax=Alkalibacillus haloalkaliphilus TaxID=94136 RepID=A0A511W2R1_9BACI|nr:hypothetical protein [Alkalibacillus haloalkaliphilus]GEN45051.1 hypothetical protein AHA02nite_08270 [Alkalibacillus haloalkaliphilus]